MGRSVTYGTNSVTKISKRHDDNNSKAAKLEKSGYIVTKNLHKNGAFLAIKNGKTRHDDFEIEVGTIIAENGISFTLEPDGMFKIRLPNKKTYTYPSLDGKIESFSQEIMGLRGRANPIKVADAIEHSRKEIKLNDEGFIQADVAISYTPEGSDYHKETIDDGVKENIRRLNAGQTKANPRIYLHVDIGKRKVFYRYTR